MRAPWRRRGVEENKGDVTKSPVCGGFRKRCIAVIYILNGVAIYTSVFLVNDEWLNNEPVVTATTAPTGENMQNAVEQVDRTVIFQPEPPAQPPDWGAVMESLDRPPTDSGQGSFKRHPGRRRRNVASLSDVAKIVTERPFLLCFSANVEGGTENFLQLVRNEATVILKPVVSGFASPAKNLRNHDSDARDSYRLFYFGREWVLHLQDVMRFVVDYASLYEKVFLNHVLGFDESLLQKVFGMGKRYISITHDFFWLFQDPQPSFWALRANKAPRKYVYHRYLNQLEMKSQHDSTRTLFGIIGRFRSLQTVPMPDLHESRKVVHKSHRGTLVGCIGAIGELKGLAALIELSHHVEVRVFGKVAHKKGAGELKVSPYSSIDELNRLLLEVKPNILILPSLWPETYSYTLTLSILTNLPVIVRTNDFETAVAARAKAYDKAHFHDFADMRSVARLAEDVKASQFTEINTSMEVPKQWTEIMHPQLRDVVVLICGVSTKVNEVLRWIEGLRIVVPNAFIAVASRSRLGVRTADKLAKKVDAMVHRFDQHDGQESTSSYDEYVLEERLMETVKEKQVMFRTYTKIRDNGMSHSADMWCPDTLSTTANIFFGQSFNTDVYIAYRIHESHMSTYMRVYKETVDAQLNAPSAFSSALPNVDVRLAALLPDVAHIGMATMKGANVPRDYSVTQASLPCAAFNEGPLNEMSFQMVSLLGLAMILPDNSAFPMVPFFSKASGSDAYMLPFSAIFEENVFRRIMSNNNADAPRLVCARNVSRSAGWHTFVHYAEQRVGHKVPKNPVEDTFFRAIMPAKHIQRFVAEFKQAVLQERGYGCLHMDTEAGLRSNGFDTPPLQVILDAMRSLPVLHSSRLIFVVGLPRRIDEDAWKHTTPWGARLVRQTTCRFSATECSFTEMAICKHAAWFVGNGASPFSMLIAKMRKGASSKSYWYPTCKGNLQHHADGDLYPRFCK